MISTKLYTENDEYIYILLSKYYFTQHCDWDIARCKEEFNDLHAQAMFFGEKQFGYCVQQLRKANFENAKLASTSCHERNAKGEEQYPGGRALNETPRHADCKSDGTNTSAHITKSNIIMLLQLYYYYYHRMLLQSTQL
ncbi:hypothetical protein WN51_13499 [Melipona quadrifasciata]|uniref:Uncharacterized protein n=1 Tax=Melipona quadrifasciata TaxID=166423 RepID=A0A0N0BGK6_9HYME|nr:hypothetical protein WN51_13499 [Melipona quadrifasciata]